MDTGTILILGATAGAIAITISWMIKIYRDI